MWISVDYLTVPMHVIHSLDNWIESSCLFLLMCISEVKEVHWFLLSLMIDSFCENKIFVRGREENRRESGVVWSAVLWRNIMQRYGVFHLFQQLRIQWDYMALQFVWLFNNERWGVPLAWGWVISSKSFRSSGLFKTVNTLGFQSITTLYEFFRCWCSLVSRQDYGKD